MAVSPPAVDVPDLFTQAGRTLLHLPRLAQAPSGTGRPVVLVPGWTTSDLVLAPMRGFLRLRGHATHPWGLGVNRGTRDQKDGLRALVERLAGDGGPVDLVGWSLGGTLARTLTHERPDLVASLTTIATPLTVQGIALAPTRPEGPRVRTVLTPGDAVVPLPQQRDPSPVVDVVEVDVSHAGSLLAPEVWLAVATWLAAPAGVPAIH